MTKIETFNKTNLVFVRENLNRELISLGEKYGVTFKAGNARFNDKCVTFKLEVTVNGEHGETVPADLVELRRFYPAVEGKEIRLSDGTLSRVVGYNKRNHKYPFVVETLRDTRGCPVGKRFKVRAGVVL